MLRVAKIQNRYEGLGLPADVYWVGFDAPATGVASRPAKTNFPISFSHLAYLVFVLQSIQGIAFGGGGRYQVCWL